VGVGVDVDSDALHDATAEVTASPWLVEEEVVVFDAASADASDLVESEESVWVVRSDATLWATWLPPPPPPLSVATTAAVVPAAKATAATPATSLALIANGSPERRGRRRRVDLRAER
jgi:hypothetical protein